MSDRYDVIVVGAGFSGLVCSNYLARLGKKVLLLEQNHQAGGNMSGIWRRGFYFDAGDQSFESLGIVFPILEDLGVLDRQSWHKVRYRMVSKDFDFFIDSIDEVEANLIEAFPDEPGIRDVFREVKEVSRFLRETGTAADLPLVNRFGVGPALQAAGWLPKLRKWLRFDYREKVCSVIRNPDLRNWFVNIGYYKMPFLFFAGFWHIWAHDYWYPGGGMQAMLDSLVDSLREHGGEVRFDTRIERLDIRDGKAAGAVTADGETIAAEKVVYAGDYKAFVERVVPPEYFSPKFISEIRNAPLTEEILSVYLGLDIDPAELQRTLQSNHIFYFPNYRVIFPDGESPRNVHRDMWVALNFFGAENPGLAPEGKSSLVLQTYSSYRWQGMWRNADDSPQRTREYRLFKREIGMQLVESAQRIIPDLANRIVYYDSGTPLSLQRFTRNSEGSTGGWCYHDKVSPVFKRWGLNMFRTPVRGLFATGHYTLWPGGVIAAALSGRIVANLVSGRPPLSMLHDRRTLSTAR